jgi:hypothetical protein
MNIADLRRMRKQGYTHAVFSNLSYAFLTKHRSLAAASSSAQDFADCRVIDINNTLESIDYDDYLSYCDEINQDRLECTSGDDYE